MIVGTLSPGAHPGSYNGQDAHTGHLIAHALSSGGADASEDGTGRGTPLVFDERNVTSKANRTQPRSDRSLTLHESPLAIAYRTSGNCGVSEQGDRTAALNCATDPTQQIVAFQTRIGRNGRGQPKDVTDALLSNKDGSRADVHPHVAYASTVRRLTPRECERLMGLPDDYTLIRYRGKPAKDAPRYRAIGNSIAVNCLGWLARRIEMVEAI